MGAGHGDGSSSTPRRSIGVQDVLGCCFEGASERKKVRRGVRRRAAGRGLGQKADEATAGAPQDLDAPQGAPEAGTLPAQLNTAMDALVEEWGSALPLLQVRRY